MGFKDDSGTLVQVPAERANDAAVRGWTFESPEQLRERELAQRYSGPGPAALAAGAGLARGLSFGLSDLALTSTGLVEGETLRQLEDRQQVASVAGELASALVPLGPGSLAIRGAQRLGAAAERIAVRELAERGISEASEGLLKRAIASAVPRAAEGAAEGALFGAGRLITEDALGRADLNGEHALAFTTIGGVLGGATSAGLGLSGLVLSETGRRASSALSRASDDIAGVADRLGLDGLRFRSVALGRPFSGTGARVRRLALAERAEPGVVAREVANELREAFAEVRDIDARIEDALGRHRLEATLPRGYLPDVRVAGVDALEAAQRALGDEGSLLRPVLGVARNADSPEAVRDALVLGLDALERVEASPARQLASQALDQGLSDQRAWGVLGVLGNRRAVARSEFRREQLGFLRRVLRDADEDVSDLDAITPRVARRLLNSIRAGDEERLLFERVLARGHDLARASDDLLRATDVLDDVRVGDLEGVLRGAFRATRDGADADVAARAIRELEGRQGDLNLGGILGGAAAGGLVGAGANAFAVPGAAGAVVAGRVVGRLLDNPVAWVRGLSFLEGAKARNQARIDAAIRALLDGKERVTRHGLPALAALHAPWIDRTSGDDDEDDARTAIALTGDIASTSARLEASIEGIRNVAPRHGDSVSAATYRLLSVLDREAPRPRALPLGGDRWEPDRQQRRRWQEARRALLDPVGTLENVVSGDASDRQLALLDEAFPALVEDVRERLLEAIASRDPDDPLDRRQRDVLRRLLGIVSEGQLSVRAAQELQGLTPPEGENPGTGGSGGGSGLAEDEAPASMRDEVSGG